MLFLVSPVPPHPTRRSTAEDRGHFSGARVPETEGSELSPGGRSRDTGVVQTERNGVAGRKQSKLSIKKTRRLDPQECLPRAPRAPASQHLRPRLHQAQDGFFCEISWKERSKVRLSNGLSLTSSGGVERRHKQHSGGYRPRGTGPAHKAPPRSGPAPEVGPRHLHFRRKSAFPPATRAYVTGPPEVWGAPWRRRCGWAGGFFLPQVRGLRLGSQIAPRVQGVGLPA